MVVDARTKEDDEKDTLRSERRSALKKDLTESALSEMSGYRVFYQASGLLLSVILSERKPLLMR